MLTLAFEEKPFQVALFLDFRAQCNVQNSPFILLVQYFTIEGKNQTFEKTLPLTQKRTCTCNEKKKF